MSKGRFHDRNVGMRQFRVVLVCFMLTLIVVTIALTDAIINRTGGLYLWWMFTLVAISWAMTARLYIIARRNDNREPYVVPFLVRCFRREDANETVRDRIFEQGLTALDTEQDQSA